MMDTKEECALDVLLFETEGVELVDIKCFRGDLENASPEDICNAIHSGIMQYRMQPDLARDKAPEHGVTPRDMREVVKGLPISG